MKIPKQTEKTQAIKENIRNIEINFAEYQEYKEKAKALEAENRLAEAVAIYEKYIELLVGDDFDKEYNIKMFDIYRDIATLYAQLFQFDKVVDYNLKAYNSMTNSLQASASFYLNISNLYSRLGDKEMELEYITKFLAVKNGSAKFDYKEVIANYTAVASIYEERGDYQSALKHLLVLLDMFFKMLRLENIERAQLHERIASIYELLNNSESDLEHTLKASEIKENLLCII